MTRQVATITIRFESEKNELDLDADIEERVWKLATDLVNDGGADEVSHVEVDVEPEDAE